MHFWLSPGKAIIFNPISPFNLVFRFQEQKMRERWREWDRKRKREEKKKFDKLFENR